MTTDTARPITPPFRVVADGIRYHVCLYEEGATMHVRPGSGRLMSWAELARLAEGPPPDRHGVVVDGRLLKVFEHEQEATDWAAEHRLLGSTAELIRVPTIV